MHPEKYPEYKDSHIPTQEQEILQFWEENKIFAQSVQSREGQATFTFYEGPPSANGMPGIHHVMARTIKDIFCRFKTLQGYQVKRKAGWDTHGLPVELSVEKELGITKEDIGTKISIEDYNRKCRETVMKYTDVWGDLTRQMGYWVDMQNPYITYHNDFIESVWHLLKKLYEKGLLYKGFTVQPYSPKAGTGLSSHELNQPGTYREVSDTSITAQFKVVYEEASAFLFDRPDEDVRILAWTTTPWTLPSNGALVIGEHLRYAKVNTYNPYTHLPVSVVLAKDRLDAYFNAKATDRPLRDYAPGDKLIPYAIEQEFLGKELVGLRYEQLLPYIVTEELQAKAFRVIPGDFVTTEDGTGVVHAATLFGGDDFRVTRQHGIPAVVARDENGNEVPLVDKQGRFVKEVSDFAGRYVKAEYETDETLADPQYKSTDVLIAIKLKEENKAFKVEKYVHSYPHCWRTDKPVLYYPLDSWFIRTTALKDKLAELNKTINWKPASTGEGRFGNWLENLVDWNLSRQRYWGIPLPIWRSEDGTEEICIGSVYELYEEIEKAREAGLMQENPIGAHEIVSEVKRNKKGEVIDSQVIDAFFSPNVFDLHRPYVDKIVLVSPTGQPMYREPDLIDVWFDSGAMPYAQWHYPFENEAQFSQHFPADFISEGVDQTRGWFFTLHAIAGLLFDSVAFRNVVSTGLVLDAEGRKMSKRLGNAVDPFKVMAMYGADATRWYMVANANPWDNLRFSWTTPEEIKEGKPEKSDKIEEVNRRFFGTLRNTYAFFALYANLDGFRFEQDEIPLAERPESDRWIISRLNSLIREVGEAYQEYEPTRAARLMQDFTTDDLSNWYVRLNRKRFWKSDYQQDKIAAYQTLYTCLETLAIMMAPIAPFYSERLFRDLNEVSQRQAFASVHLAYFPKTQPEAIDADLEQRMALAQKISSLTHALRKKAKVRVRQPLKKILVPVLDETIKSQIAAVSDLILSEVNVKALELVGDDSGLVVKSVKPNFKTLGTKYKQEVKKVVALIQSLGKQEIAQLERSQVLEKEGFALSLEDVLIQSEEVEGFSVESENGLTVALDLEITEELRAEGLARDFVNRLQNLRKDSGLEVQDKIDVVVAATDHFVQAALLAHRDYIATETQALELRFDEALTEGETFEIEAFTIQVYMQVVRG
ncbi:MAG: isoleucine--tRNA ligase [Microscillaceae bacterium]